MTNPETIVGEIYDAWRAQDLEWLASYLPDDFCHIIHIPQDIHPLGGTCRGKAASIDRANARIVGRRVISVAPTLQPGGQPIEREARPSPGFFFASAGDGQAVLKWLPH